MLMFYAVVGIKESLKLNLKYDVVITAFQNTGIKMLKLYNGKSQPMPWHWLQIPVSAIQTSVKIEFIVVIHYNT